MLMNIKRVLNVPGDRSRSGFLCPQERLDEVKHVCSHRLFTVKGRSRIMLVLSQWIWTLHFPCM